MKKTLSRLTFARALTGAALVALVATAPAGQSQASDPLPLNLGGAYALTDHTGARRTQADPAARAQLLFFGYANCQEICSAALPLMGQAVEDLAAQGLAVTPVMITVDPARDTVAAMGPKLRLHHPDFIGLTGDPAQLKAAYDAFQIDIEEVFFDPEFGPVYAHGSFLYLLDGDGRFLTLIPPILAPKEVARIVAGYL
ncbi:MAG: SCO family protein [Pseudomonadota bacterium]